MKEEIQNPYPNNNCFFCGSENKKGLNLKFYWDKEKKETSTEYLPAQYFVARVIYFMAQFKWVSLMK